ncbi:MAG: hypothetical protein ACQEP9_07515 [Bacillota bacterium]
MEKFLVVGLVVIMFITLIGTAQASYYDLKLNIGEQTSQLNNLLFLDYQGQVNGYQLETELRLDKDYRFLAGTSYAGDWNLNDYLLRLSNDDSQLEIGETKATNSSYFLAADSLVGISATKDDYSFWYGQNLSDGFSFGGQSSGFERLGVSYQGEKRKYSYQYQEEVMNDRHYLSYQDAYQIADFDLLTDLALVGTDEQLGTAVQLDLSSWYQGINYRGQLNYYTPDFQEVEEQILASGEYDLSFKVYKRLNQNYLLESRINYNRDNLDNSQSATNRKWRIDNTVNYFTANYDNYQLGVDYIVNNYQEDKIVVNLSGDLDPWQLDFNYNRQAEQIFDWGIDYNGDNYNLAANYSLEDSEGDWEQDFASEADYTQQITTQLASNSIANLSYSASEYRLDLTQGFEYQVTQNQTLDSRLIVHYYSNSEQLSKQASFNYKYQF